MHMGRQLIITPIETVTPIPAKQVQTTGGHPRVKQLAALPKPALDKPPAAAMHAAHEAGPA